MEDHVPFNRLLGIRGESVAPGRGVLLLPAKLQTEPATIERLLSRGLDRDGFDFERPHAELARMGADLGIPVVDLLPEARQRVAAGEELYFPEGHLNRAGHALAARRLAEAIAATVPAGP